MNPQQAQERAQQLVYQYNNNPKDYTDDQAKKVAFLAQQLGLPFRPESKALSKFFFDLTDKALFGLLPDTNRPKSRGEEYFGETAGERTAGALANIGYLAPIGLGAAAAGPFAAMAVRALPTQARNAILSSPRLNQALQGAMGGAAGFSLMDLVEDPLGTPGRALQGGLYGGALGGAFPGLGGTRASAPLQLS